MMVVQWAPILGHSDYEVSNEGSVRSHKYRTPRLLKPWRNSNGYLRVTLGGKKFYVHSLVAAAFHGPRPAGMEIRHLDGSRDNNAATNLAYGTHAQNMADLWGHGTKPQLSITHCPQGHEYPKSATPGSRRSCGPCRQATKSRYVASKVGVYVTCDHCGRSISALNFYAHGRRDACVRSEVA